MIFSFQVTSPSQRTKRFQKKAAEKDASGSHEEAFANVDYNTFIAEANNLCNDDSQLFGKNYEGDQVLH